MNPHILALLHFAHQQELKLVGELSEAERNATGTPDSWVAKDFLVNILCWKALQTQKLGAAQQGEIPPVWKDMDVVHQINREAFAHYQNGTFQEIEAKAEHVFHALIAQVERMSEEELNDPYSYSWQEGDPLRGELLANGLWFPCNQLTTCALQLGHTQFAFALQATLLAEMRQSTLPPEDIAGSIYNAACFYALHRQPEQALQLLLEAFHLKPTLFEWARHDADLDTLRTNPTFQAILPVSELISPQNLQASVRGDTPPLIIDVRGAAEYTHGHVAGAVNIPLGKLKSQPTQLPQDRRIITYCNMHHRGGSRGEQAAILLCNHGYHAQTLDGGYPAWKEQGFPVEAAPRVE